jgi:hypothetical protein
VPRRRTGEKDEQERVGEDSAEAGSGPVAAMSFAVIFLAESGRLTQILRANLAARRALPLTALVGSGAVLAGGVALARSSAGSLWCLHHPDQRIVRRSAVAPLGLAGYKRQYRDPGIDHSLVRPCVCRRVNGEPNVLILRVPLWRHSSRTGGGRDRGGLGDRGEAPPQNSAGVIRDGRWRAHLRDGFTRMTKLAFPSRFPIVQFPNAPLIAAFVAGQTAQMVHGAPHAYLVSIGYLATTVWAYEEMARGVNWFRRLLGLVFAIVLIIRVAHVVHTGIRA